MYVLPEMRRYKVSLFVRELSCQVSDRIYSFLKLLVGGFGQNVQV